MRIHRLNSIVRIPSCRFEHADFIVRVPLCAFHRFHQMHSIECLPSSVFHRAYSTEPIPSSAFHQARSIKRAVRANSIVRIPSYVFHCKCYQAHSVVRIPMCAFDCVHFSMCVPLYVFHRAIDGGKKDKRGRGGGYIGASYLQLYLRCRWHQPGCINRDRIE